MLERRIRQRFRRKIGGMSELRFFGGSYSIKSHCLRKPGRAKRWGSADFKDILVMQSLSHMNTNGRGLRNFKCFLSENDHPPSFWTLMRPQTILINVNFERLILIISLRFLDGNFLCNLSVYSLMLWCKNILVFSRNLFFIWPQKNVNLHKFWNTQICTYCKSLSFNPAAVYFLFETIFAFFKVNVTWKEK